MDAKSIVVAESRKSIQRQMLLLWIIRTQLYIIQTNIYLFLKEEHRNIAYISHKILCDVHIKWNTQLLIQKIIWVQLPVSEFLTLWKRATVNIIPSQLVKEFPQFMEPNFWYHVHGISLLGAELSLFNLLKPTGYVMNQQFNIQQLYALPTLYFCVLYLSENKQRLVPLTA
jgi:hypothetical protein